MNMIIYQKILDFRTKKRGTVDITDAVEDAVQSSLCEIALCNVFIQHTSASLIISENADPTVRSDLECFMQRFIPDGDAIFKHTAEGPDDMPAHLRTVLTQTSLSIPVKNHQLLLGAWQGIYLWEHRNGKFRRRIIVSVYGEG